jgi:hypothetical protein
MLGDETVGGDEFRALDKAIERRLAIGSLCLLLDLSLLLDRSGRIFGDADRAFFNNLRALRDAHKYRLTYAAATRHALPPGTELAELFLAHTLWLGPLAESDAQWTVMQFAIREGLKWGEPEARALTLASGGYAAFLRATCEARAAGAELESIATHPALRARVEEFLSDQPTADELRRSGLDRHPFLRAPGLAVLDTTTLTAKENLLLAYFRAHANAVCAKDDLIRAVWPEDKVFERGVRDDSLAQLVRRLREKIESDPANPRHILTIPGRGYRFVAD